MKVKYMYIISSSAGMYLALPLPLTIFPYIDSIKTALWRGKKS